MAYKKDSLLCIIASINFVENTCGWRLIKILITWALLTFFRKKIIYIFLTFNNKLLAIVYCKIFLSSRNSKGGIKDHDENKNAVISSSKLIKFIVDRDL